MSEIYRVRLSRRAADQLTEIFDYIEQGAPQNAARLIRRLVRAMDSLETLPHRFSVVRDTQIFRIEVRSMPVRPYLIRYHIDESANSVTILSVRHGARKPGL